MTVTDERLCPTCNLPLSDEQVSHGVERHAHCYGQTMTVGRVASTPWARFLERKRSELRISQNALGRMLGVTPATTTRWRKGGAPLADAYKQALALWPGEVPKIETETDRRKEPANADRLNGVPTEVRHERAVRAGEAGRGKPKPGQSDRMKAWHASPDGREHAKRLSDEGRLAALSKTTKGRVRLALGCFLRDHPELVEQGPPAMEVLRDRAEVVAEDHELTGDAVLALWKGKLRKLGIWRGPGRTAEDARWEEVERLRNAGVPWRQVHRTIDPQCTQATLERGFREWRKRQR